MRAGIRRRLFVKLFYGFQNDIVYHVDLVYPRKRLKYRGYNTFRYCLPRVALILGSV